MSIIMPLHKEETTMVSTGTAGLDNVIDSLRLGDNVVLQVSDIKVYTAFARSFVNKSLAEGRKVIYMRFARHEPIIMNQAGVTIHHIDAENGFESFSTQVHNIITAEGKEVFYVFDCLSELLHAWATDLMIGNFFMITCPYLFKLDTIAYFALYKNSNSFETIKAIRNTTQVLLDAYEANGRTYVHPLKVWNRHSSTIYLPHIQQGEEFLPITNSGDAAALLAGGNECNFDNPKRYMDYWDRIFMDAAELQEKINIDEANPAEEKKLLKKLCKMIMTRDKRFLTLLTNTFTLKDLLNIKSRMIGSGFIGGKAVGMLLARKMLSCDSETDWDSIIEQHDSFFVGSDVFYTYLVENGLWKLRMDQKQPENYFRLAPVLRDGILAGRINQKVQEQFLRILEYFGQSPIIVRSSSLLEDSFGSAFAGKYESVYCTNQGTLEERYEEFEKAVRTIFASTMNESALTYRLQRELSDRDEQMALLVQRVSGCHRQQYFFPDMAGVGYSHNTYVWEKNMDPKAGMLRVVAGLGTRAVNRVNGDYVRIIALDNPLLKPYAGIEDFKGFSQRKVDLLNLKANSIQTVELQNLVDDNVELKLNTIAQRDYKSEQILERLKGRKQASWILTFDKLASETSFPGTMHKLLKALEQIYQCPVDVEFTVNFTNGNNYRINLLQCRPLQVKGFNARVEFPHDIKPDKILFRGHGGFMGGNIQRNIDRIIFVEPRAYNELNESGKYSLARAIGKINRLTAKDKMSVMLLGPGRWGTTTASLGVPVNFAEISNMSVLGEIAYPKAGYAPEVSYGTHFFNDLVENEIFYVALNPERQEVVFQSGLMSRFPDLFPEILPQESLLQGIIRVHDVGALSQQRLEIVADVSLQEVICCFLNKTLDKK